MIVTDILDLQSTGYFLSIVEKRSFQWRQKEIKKYLVNSLINNEKVKTEELNEQADKVESSEDTTAIIKEYKDIICTKKKIVAYISYQHGSFPNTQREKKFINLVKRFKVHKTKMISKINIKLINILD